MSTIVVTGATAGFGQETARTFAAKGWEVVITGRRLERLQELEKELSSKTKVTSLCFDVRDQSQVADQLGSLGPVDVLVNNAGLSRGLDRVPEASVEDWEEMIDTNIKGLLYCTRTLVPKMVERNSGHIVNIGSVAGSWPYPGGNVYGGTKAFVRQFSRGLKADLLGTNVRVSNIEPGLAETEFSLVRYHGDSERAKKVYDGASPLTALDIASIIYFLVTLPAHVNVTNLEVMPTTQAWAPLTVSRKEN